MCTWIQSVGDTQSDHLQRILPDGCADIVWIGDSASLVVGPATQAVIARLPPRSTIVGARFRPGMAPGLLGVPASELLNTEVPLKDVWGEATETLAGQIGRLRSAEARLRALEAALIARLSEAGPADELVAAAVAWLARHPTGRVHQLSRELDITSRHLLRRFTAAVGYGPKTLQRILRLQRLLLVARKKPARQLSLTLLAAEAGYADQAHMTREVVRLTGVSPTVLLSRADSTHA